MFVKKQYALVLWVFLLWRFCRTKAHMDVCDAIQPGIFCNCESFDRETTVTCFIFNSTLINHDEIWDSLAEVDNLLRLNLLCKVEASLDYIPAEAVGRMSSLQTLSIKEGNLGELKTKAICGLKQLQDLDLVNNNITSLQNRAICDLPKLRRLTLSENVLRELLANSLTGLDELELLFLDRNSVSRIESCAFCDLQNLRELELWGNQITDITEYTFRGLRFLKRLDLFKNKIKILNDKVFQTMPKLQELDIKSNLISHIKPGAFHGLEKLHVLRLNENKLKVLPDDVFKPLPRLRSLELQNNLFEMIQRKVLENMANAKDEHFHLSLKENPFKCNCQLQWVKTYLKVNKSHQFTRELQEMKCELDEKVETDLPKLNVSVYLEEQNCKKSNSKSKVVTTSRSVTKATEQIPVELFISKKKGLSTEDTVYVSDVDDDAVGEDQEAESVDHSGGIQIISSFYVISFASLLVIRMRNFNIY